ncbi:uncharacterized protein J3R85_010805 [Psidium guajava]|nr:uncharacterized protein J3R85_010805 [Psidium guajava]
MAIEKNSFKVSRFDSDFSPVSRESMSSDEDEILHRSSAAESDEDDEFDDADSGAGSDDFDLLELGETGAEFCQVESQTCRFPFELYDLPGLEDILSVDVWNELLTEDERLGLTKYLPDMDQETYMLTLKELFTGCNIHFGSPLKKVFDMLKGGLCEPRVALYREGLHSFRKRQHYHLIRKHQNCMVSNLCQIRDAWKNCRGYSIEEKLRVLNILKTQKSLMAEKEDMVSDPPSGREDLGEALWSKKGKDRKISQKMSRNSPYMAAPSFEYPLQEQVVAPQRKKNPKGTLKLARSKTPSTKELAGGFPSTDHGPDYRAGPYGSGVPSRLSKAAGFDKGAALRKRDQIRGDDEAEDPIFGAGPRRDPSISRSVLIDKPAFVKVEKKNDFLKSDDFTADGFVGLPLSSKGDLHIYRRNKPINQSPVMKTLAIKPPNLKVSQDYAKKSMYLENIENFAAEDQNKSAKGRGRQPVFKGNRVDFSGRRTKGEALSTDLQFDERNAKSKKWSAARESPDISLKPLTDYSPSFNHRFLPSDVKGKFSQGKGRGSSRKNKGQDLAVLRGNSMGVNGDVTESDSSDLSDDEDSDHLMGSEFAYPGSFMDVSHSAGVKSVMYDKRENLFKNVVEENPRPFEGTMHEYNNLGNWCEQIYIPEEESYTLKAKQKGKMQDNLSVKNSARVMDSGYNYSSVDDDRRKFHGKNGRMQGEPGERHKAYPSGRKQRVDASHSDYIVEQEDEVAMAQRLSPDNELYQSGNRGKKAEAYSNDRHERLQATFPGSNTMNKKRKIKEDVVYRDDPSENGGLHADVQQQNDDIGSSKRRIKKKPDADNGPSDNEIVDMPIMETGVTDVEFESKPKKKTFTLITPTVHTGFSFSIVHLLSAVRMAMITLLPEDSIAIGKPMEDQNGEHEGGDNEPLSQKSMATSNSEHAADGNVPSLTIQEIVNRVRSNPGDPCILETQEPLQDLVRGVLKIFSSRTAPLGAKGWKALVVFEKSTKSWSWIGPVSFSPSDHDTIEEVTSPEAWGLPHKMLVKLVDSFANWLKSGQETLQQIGSLPPPPLVLLQFDLDEKDRFRDLRAQKSLNTITPSSEEVRAYFRKEEFLRYSIPDRAFSYTAADGKKSIVAPLRRCGGKPTSKARDHFMLKRDRPPHVTILCLVRDAAARLPGSIGTRADVCTLIRDSQFVVEDVSDAQVNQVVSGALDRLHYERDPCVQFDGERKLWKYLHREREEEDFEDDGTSSTKKWKRPRKDAPEQSDQGTVTVAYHVPDEQTGFDLCSDLNAEPFGAEDDKAVEPVCDDMGQDVDDGICNAAEQANIHQRPSIGWEGLDFNPTQEKKLLCQENSTNEDFDDESFGRDRAVELLSSGLF